MKATIKLKGKDYKIDLSKPIDISIPLKHDAKNPNAWWATHPIFEPVVMGDFVGSTKSGSPVNFYNVKFNPHGNGTHTECVGHISNENHTINQCLKQFWFKAELISLKPEKIENGDKVITKDQIKTTLASKKNFDALVIRTLPNPKTKMKKVYGGSNPPYVQEEAMQLIVKKKIKHLMIDLPSVDRENDAGKLLAHHTFWNYPPFGTKATRKEIEKININHTITELIYVPDTVKDGSYFVNICIASFELDASPSKIVLYAIG